MSGKLYVCATPIGNLEDITYRVLRILKEADLIAAEDTRNSVKLLNHFEINTPMTSYHEFNKIEKAKQLITSLNSGKSIALITDAGTPGISDPGEELVRMCYEEGIEVIPVPGAAACITALSACGLPSKRFCFEAFLPRDKRIRGIVLNELKNETRTIVLYEAPHRLSNTLKELLQILGNRNLCLCRELTKKHEEFKRTTIEESIEFYQEHESRGEYVLVIEGKSYEDIKKEKQREWESMTLDEHMSYYEAKGNSRKEAMKLVAKDRGISKREVYDIICK